MDCCSLLNLLFDVCVVGGVMWMVLLAWITLHLGSHILVLERWPALRREIGVCEFPPRFPPKPISTRSDPLRPLASTAWTLPYKLDVAHPWLCPAGVQPQPTTRYWPHQRAFLDCSNRLAVPHQHPHLPCPTCFLEGRGRRRRGLGDLCCMGRHGNSSTHEVPGLRTLAGAPNASDALLALASRVLIKPKEHTNSQAGRTLPLKGTEMVGLGGPP